MSDSLFTDFHRGVGIEKVISENGVYFRSHIGKNLTVCDNDLSKVKRIIDGFLDDPFYSWMGKDKVEKVKDDQERIRKNCGNAIRYTWIDGIYTEVKMCSLCPFLSTEYELGASCKYPHNPANAGIAFGLSATDKTREDCPLRMKI